MASVLLPTREWTDSCAALASQLGPGDELLVLCDRPTDPVARDPPDPADAPDGSIEVVPTGDPEACSGKAHALAVGLDRARDDLVVLTDDDVERDPDWFSRLVGLAREHGAASATPVFVGEGLSWLLVEPVMTALGSALICRYGGAWGGGVAFERDRLDEARYRRDLERTVSDDALLWDALGDVHTTPSFVNVVRVPGDAASVRERFTRFVLTYRYWLPRATLALWALVAGFVALALVAPFVAAGVATAGAAYAYRYLGLRRRTWLLAFPSVLFLPVFLASAWLVPSFTWGGRKYRWRGRFDVAVSDA